MCAANRSECSECKWYLDISEGSIRRKKGHFLKIKASQSRNKCSVTSKKELKEQREEGLILGILCRRSFLYVSP